MDTTTIAGGVFLIFVGAYIGLQVGLTIGRRQAYREIFGQARVIRVRKNVLDSDCFYEEEADEKRTKFHD